MNSSSKIALFVLLDVSLVAALLSMSLCMHPMRFDFVSAWMLQCQDDAQAYVLPIVVVILCVLVVLLQFDWMYRVSLHHLQEVAKLDASGVYFTIAAQAQPAAADATRTRMLISVLERQPKPHVVCVDGHSDAAFVASFATIVGIACLVRWNWKWPQTWLHYYGVLLFCCGFFVVLQIVWLNLHTSSVVARLRHMQPRGGMHWLVDSAIILCLTVLMLGFAVGLHGRLVVASELLGFALMLFQFLYVFQACCYSAEPLVLQRRASSRTRLLACLLLVLPLFWPESR